MTLIVLLVLVFLLIAKELAARDADVRRERETRDTRHFYETMLARERTDSDERYQLALTRQREERNYLIEQIRDAEARAAEERTRLVDRILALTSPRSLAAVADANIEHRVHDAFAEFRDRLEGRRDPVSEYVDPETKEVATPVGFS